MSRFEKNLKKFFNPLTPTGRISRHKEKLNIGMRAIGQKMVTYEKNCLSNCLKKLLFKQFVAKCVIREH
jgi:hypothetical protein